MASKGSYYARKLKNGWVLYLNRYENGIKQRPVRVTGKALYELGFKTEWTAEQAKERTTQLNKQKSIEHRALTIASRRVEDQVVADKVYFPQGDIDAFLVWLKEKNFGSDAHFEKLVSHFRTIQKMILELKMGPESYDERSGGIFKWIIKHGHSVDYGNKLIRMLNMWGKFVAKKNGMYFEEAPYIVPGRGKVLAQVIDSQRSKSKPVRRKSLPLTLDKLKRAKSEGMETEALTYLHATLWLGLRPHEADGMLDGSVEWYVDTVEGVEVLHVKQTKLVTLPDDEKWKHIPLLHKEQLKAIANIENKKMHVPTAKTIAKYVGEKHDKYCGRKGFTDLMLSLGEDLVHISSWMGHQTLNTTTRHYKDRKRVMMRRPKKSG